MKLMKDFLTWPAKWLAVGLIVAAGMAYESTPAKAGGGSFIGGMVAGHMLGGFIRRDKARTQAQTQAYRPPPAQPTYQAYRPPPAQPDRGSVEQRIKELESLASKGIISKQEYQARRKAILDGI